ncbi:enolase C-terminal domain-like protein [Gordonia sp. NPDC003424]
MTSASHHSIPGTMSAVLLTGHGGLDKLEYRTDVPTPQAKSDEVLIHVAAAGINNTDVNTRIGLKISKTGGLTRGRRHHDICQAAGMTMSVQDTTGSAIAFAAILHLGASIAPRFLRCILNTEDMVTLTTADLAIARNGAGGVLAPTMPGLGIDVRQAVLGEPVATWAR